MTYAEVPSEYIPVHPVEVRHRLTLLADLLERAYGTPEEELGNQRDALDEAVYIILTYQTGIDRARSTWAALRERFPTWEEADRAEEPALIEALRDGGLHRQKARIIKRLLASVRSEFGELSLQRLEMANDSEAEQILLRLPGLSRKGARCVLLYALDRQVFPVDVNTFRVLKRIGVISPNAVYQRLSLHDELQDATQASKRRSLHVNLVVHGQRTCLPRWPLCSACPVRVICEGRDLYRRQAEALAS